MPVSVKEVVKMQTTVSSWRASLVICVQAFLKGFTTGTLLKSLGVKFSTKSPDIIEANKKLSNDGFCLLLVCKEKSLCKNYVRP